jgi:ABC-2 type transport system ATP-binding protein
LYELAEGGTTILVTTHYLDEAEHCQRLAFIQRGQMVTEGSPEQIKAEQMPGDVIEIDCTRPDQAIQALRRTDHFAEVALYGALIHVVTQAGESVEQAKTFIEQVLAQTQVAVRSVERIVPSLEDVFIASVR